MENSETLIKEILEANKVQIKESLNAEIKKQIIESLSWRLRDELGKMASEFVETEMKEDIKKMLIEQKPILMEHLKDAFVKISAQLAGAMVGSAMKNLEIGSYKANDIIKKILD